MDYPHGHRHHHHRRDGDDDDDERRPPPPPSYGGEDFDYPPHRYHRHDVDDERRPLPPSYGGGDYDHPTHAYQRHHHLRDDEDESRPFPPSYGGGDYAYPPPGYRPPPPSYSGVEHVSHVIHGSHGSHGSHGAGGAPPRQPTVRIFCKANENFSLTISEGTVCLARTNRDDEYQHWIKDMKYSTRVKDEEGYPAFSLVNKVTGEVLKHSLGQSHPVRLISHNPEYLDESVLWTESRDVGNGFRCIRMVNNIHLNFDAFHGDKDHGGVRDGTTLVLWKWCQGDNQRWKIVLW